MLLPVAPAASVHGSLRPTKARLLALAIAGTLFLAPFALVNAQTGTPAAPTARASQALVMRSGPRSDAPRIGTLARGSRVTVLATRSGWSQVSIDGRKGWVVSRALDTELRSAEAPRRVEPATMPAPSSVSSAPVPSPAVVSPEPPQRTSVTPDVPSTVDDTARSRVGTFTPGDGPLVLGVRTWLAPGMTSLGVFGEWEVTPQLPKLGNGSMGVSVSADYFSVDAGIVDASVIPVVGMANYHLRVPAVPRLDPFVGAGLGYAIARVSATVNNQYYSVSGTSGLFFAGHVGARWYVSDHFGAQAELMFGRLGSGQLALGLSWRP